MYTIHCPLYNVTCTLYNIQCYLSVPICKLGSPLAVWLWGVFIGLLWLPRYLLETLHFTLYTIPQCQDTSCGLYCTMPGYLLYCTVQYQDTSCTVLYNDRIPPVLYCTMTGYLLYCTVQYQDTSCTLLYNTRIPPVLYCTMPGYLLGMPGLPVLGIQLGSMTGHSYCWGWARQPGMLTHRV